MREAVSVVSVIRLLSEMFSGISGVFLFKKACPFFRDSPIHCTMTQKCVCIFQVLVDEETQMELHQIILLSHLQKNDLLVQA